jgi:hypothetical protein
MDMIPVRMPVREALEAPQDKWQEWIEECAPEFADPETAAALIVSIAKGVKFTMQRFVLAKEEESLCPPLVFPTERKVDMGLASYLPKSKTICVTHEFFDKLAYTPLDEIVELRSFCDHQKFIGMPLDLSFLIGVEEADHALFCNEHPEIIPELLNEDDPNDESEQPKYDSQPIEFRALERQLIAAQELLMPSITIQCLETRIKVARQFLDTESPLS